MKRKQVPQISNQPWFPGHIRTLMHEFMSWFVGKVQAAKPFMPVIEEGLLHADDQQLINLKMAMGAGIETVIPHLPANIQVKHTPAQSPDTSKKGLYLSINSFHQLPPDQARELLTKVSQSRNPLAVVEGNNDSLWQVFGMVVIVPLSVLLTAPFVKPFRWSRLLFTYLIPILPVITFLDGFLALFKLYAPADLDELVSDIQVPDYQWRSGKMDNGRGGKIIYLLGKGIS